MSADYILQFTKCYNLYAPRLIRFVSVRIGDSESATDIVQDIFTYLYERKIVIDCNSPSISGFLFQIARHRVIDFSQKSAKSIDSNRFG